MTIQEMHSAFRTIGQQMGLQLVRGILPESIDVFLNDVIQEKVQQELLTNTRTVIQETVDTQASTMGGLNILRNLYRSDRVVIDYPTHISENGGFGGGKAVEWKQDREFEHFGFIEYYNPKNSYHEILCPIVGGDFYVRHVYDESEGGWISVGTKPEGFIIPMMYLGFSVEYSDTIRGNAIPCRMIGADVLDTTLRDFCNGASKDMPIVSLLSKTHGSDNKPYIQIYINDKQNVVKVLNIKYIKTPNKVKLAQKDSEVDINCDLPEYCHYEIVERAVQKYKIAIGGQIAEPRNNR